MKNLRIETPAYNNDTLKLMSTLYVNEAEDLPLLAGTLPDFAVKLLNKIDDSYRVTFAHKPESEIATGNRVILVRFNNERHYRIAIYLNLGWDVMVFASPYFNTSDLGNGSHSRITSVDGSGNRNTVSRDITKKCFQPDVRSIMKRISKVELVSATTYQQWCFIAQKDAMDTLTAANESAAITRIIGAQSRWNTESLPDVARLAAFHAMDSILRGTPLPPGVLSESVVDSFSAAFKKVDAAREDDAAAQGKTLVQVIKLKADKNFLVKCGDTAFALEQLPDNVAVAAATMMTVGVHTVLGIGAQVEANPALEMNMVLLIEGTL